MHELSTEVLSSSLIETRLRLYSTTMTDVAQLIGVETLFHLFYLLIATMFSNIFNTIHRPIPTKLSFTEPPGRASTREAPEARVRDPNMPTDECNLCKRSVPLDESMIMPDCGLLFCLSHATGDVFGSSYNTDMALIRQICKNHSPPAPIPLHKKRRRPRQYIYSSRGFQ